MGVTASNRVGGPDDGTLLSMALDACRAANRWARGQYREERAIEAEVLHKTRAVLGAAGIPEDLLAKGGDNGADED